jgi:hypothetical protein
MSKAEISFYDWERFYEEKESKEIYSEKNQPKKASLGTSLGISKEEFKAFLEKWKKENLK